ncbi:MAG: hypothetical protein HQ565_00695 [Bacteroidetes bacterium]|nr:hypothetical protein [Bacteroidota bacterium]
MTRILHACFNCIFSKMRRSVLVFLIICISFNTFGQQDSSSVNPKRLNFLLIGGAALYTGTMIGLYHLWYKDNLHSSFSFTNDTKYCMNLDKFRHAFTSYWIGRLSYHSLKWAGVKEKHAIWYGGSMGFFFLTTVDIFDGFSTDGGLHWAILSQMQQERVCSLDNN